MSADSPFLELALREFQRLKKQAEDAVAQLSEAQFFQSDSEHDNSIAIIYKHMAGNMISRWSDFLNTDGEKPNRDRDSEFIIAEADAYTGLTERWDHAWKTLFSELAPLTENDLSRTVIIRGESLSVLQAIGRQLTHYAYHIGQIVYIAKHLAGPNWNSLSIPRGQSAAFNKSPAKYLPKT